MYSGMPGRDLARESFNLFCGQKRNRRRMRRLNHSRPSSANLKIAASGRDMFSELKNAGPYSDQTLMSAMNSEFNVLTAGMLDKACSAEDPTTALNALLGAFNEFKQYYGLSIMG